MTEDVKNAYKTLKLMPGASSRTIKRAYKDLEKQYGGAKGSGSKEWGDIEKAYQLLKSLPASALEVSEDSQVGEEKGKSHQPLYRREDWVSMALTTFLVMVGYLFTMAPDLTLEDCGELAVGSLYAGVPHPPGYPVWTVYTWLFTKLIPFGNIAWRVTLSSAFASALSCGIIALMVSRGGSMLLESLDLFKGIERKFEKLLCVVAGATAGMLMGFNGFMWSQAVIVEVYTLSVLSLVGTLAFLLRWIHDPTRHRYVYWALFLFGICFTNHQTLVVAAVGIEVLILCRDRQLGRDLFLANGLIYVLGLILKANDVWGSNTNDVIIKMYHVIGFASLVTGGVMVFFTELKIFTRWKTVLGMGLCWLFGISFYLYMPLASMSNPPMNWGYPRTTEGFFHALLRGQYEKPNPTSDVGRFLGQLWEYGKGAVAEFNLVYVLIGLIPLALVPRMKNRERSWIIGLTGIYLCLAILLLILLNPQPDLASAMLNRVFFTASHVMIAMGIGYGLILLAGFLSLHFQAFRVWFIGGGLVASFLGLLGVIGLETNLPTPRAAAMFALILAAVATMVFLLSKRVPTLPTLGLIALMPLQPFLNHWWDNEQAGHLFGYWFGHDMFTPPFADEKGEPLYPEMARHAVLFGGTDPGRFNPTYMIFAESFTDPEDRRDESFDRRDVYIITQNALADGTYLSYIRAHYNRSTQIDPPFFSELLRTKKARELGRTNLLAKIVRPLDSIFISLGDSIEKERRVGTSWLDSEHFTDLEGLVRRLQSQDFAPGAYLLEQLSEKTRERLNAGKIDSGLAKGLAKDWNAMLDNPSIHTPERFAGIEISPYLDGFIRENPQGHTRVRLNRLLLEAAFPESLAKSQGGVYPDREIITPSPEDSQWAFQTYLADASKRLAHDRQFAADIQQGKRQPLLKPGENVVTMGDKVSVSGQVSVMAINAILTKLIFDKNPDNEFYVEESFPLDWMFPYLTPYGIIMKINRRPIAEMTQDIVDRDHQFWTQYSERLIGNWITYDTPVEEVVQFATQVFVHGDLRNFRGDRKFVRDDNAQKAFSKLRSGQGNLYMWRAMRTQNGEEQKRLLKEAEFAFKQSFAFCPYSPEAVFKYVQLLTQMGRVGEAVGIARVCYLIDTANAQIEGLYRQLEGMNVQAQAQQAVMPPGQPQPQAPSGLPQPQTEVSLTPEGKVIVERMESIHAQNPGNVTNTLQLASAYMQLQRTNESLALLRQVVTNMQSDANVVTAAAQMYAQLQRPAELEVALTRLVQLSPESPEAWYDLATVQASIGKLQTAASTTTRAIQLSDRRRAGDTNAQDLRPLVLKEFRLQQVIEFPAVKALLDQTNTATR